MKITLKELKSLVRSEIRRTLRENFDPAVYIAGRVEGDPSRDVLAQLYPTEDRGARTEPSSGQPIGRPTPEDIDAYAEKAAKQAAYSWNDGNYILSRDLLTQWAETGKAKKSNGEIIETYKNWNKNDWQNVLKKFKEEYAKLLKDPKSIDMRRKGAKDYSQEKNPFIPESKTSLQEVMNELFER